MQGHQNIRIVKVIVMVKVKNVYEKGRLMMDERR